MINFIHNGSEIETDMDGVFRGKWIKSIYSDEVLKEPSLCIFNNIVDACMMLYKHLKARSRICLHVDVDMDGFGNSYILKQAFELVGVRVQKFIINSRKEHGINETCVNKVNDSKSIDLLIISDSSCNEVELIKKLNCDVLVIDHHEVLVGESKGKTVDGHEFIVVNNRAKNDNYDNDIARLREINSEAFKDVEEYIPCADMSCGVVVYELLRVFMRLVGMSRQLSESLLMQWAALTLFTDSIDTCNERNQWYIRSLKGRAEYGLFTLTNSINKYRSIPDKSFILYNIAPMFNKAIRAAACTEALRIIMKEPSNVSVLEKYKYAHNDAIYKVVYEDYIMFKNGELLKGLSEEEAIDNFTKYIANNEVKKVAFKGDYICLNLTNYDVDVAYTGVIAGNLCGDNKKNVVCYITNPDTGTVKGSFRGRYRADYRKYFDSSSDYVYAQGHEQAFGLECTEEELYKIMNGISTVEERTDTREYFSVGNIPENEQGIYHIKDMVQFKQNGMLIAIANGNSRVVANDEIYIKVKTSDIQLIEQHEKYATYDVFGVECIAFEKFTEPYIKMYAELSNQYKFYLKHM